MFSLEMTQKEILRRMCAASADVNLQDFDRHIYDENERLAAMSRMANVMPKLNDAPVEAPVIKEGFVVRWDWRNSRMVEVRDDDGVKYIVRVNNAMKWRPDRQGNSVSRCLVIYEKTKRKRVVCNSTGLCR